ncbi:related to mRNA export factor mex67 [Melanopsichium pennsylvanicum]|uniref:mRNA export factor MEX67 n=2 Tax=Melanopsichium pennsylvanicum TaxID=63383 RepID=A0AAJ4XIV0_9BASI|nr:related to mRNA export factor mex67 [Melanopsichium pennsylvanicum 4]SNX83197.1 related to mRNA export factor mex67 [Melanopsichium pennsylvanicum]
MSRRGGRGGHTIAGAALRNAGLVTDGDVGMRDAAGPSRSRTGGAGGRRAGRNAGVDPSNTNGSGSSLQGRIARQRANPFGNRPPAKGKKAAINVNDGIRAGNTASLLKSISSSKAQGGGRIPGGGGIVFSGNDMPKTQNVVSLIKRFLESRWNPQAKFLNLENMRADPILQAEGIKPPGVVGCPKELGNVIWKLCSETCPDVVTISLANNGFRSLGPVSSLPVYFPHLQNLSLEGNELKWTKDLDTYGSRKHKLTNLKELLLTGNPVHASALAAGNEEGYRREVLSKFRNLTLLDQKPVTPTESGFANLPSSGGKSKKVDADAAQVPLRNFPVPNKPGFVDEAAGSIMPNFLSQYFTLYDSDRSQLSEAYAPLAQFSFCLNVVPPPRARAAGFIHTMPHQKELNFDRYLDNGNRNLMRVHTPKARHQSLHHGVASILACLRKLPKTSHPLNDASKFVVDAWVLPNNVIGARLKGEERPEALLYINVHGEYAEVPKKGIRSFDRTFAVAPTPPDSPAAAAGWPCVILSDQLVVRHYSSPSAWAPDSLPTGDVNAEQQQALQAARQNGQASVVPQQPGVAAPGSVENPTAPGSATALPPHLQNQAPAAGINEQQHAMSLQLATQTGLIYPFAVQCLQENGWDYNLALSNFQNLKASNAIPPQAFAQSV